MRLVAALVFITEKKKKNMRNGDSYRIAISGTRLMFRHLNRLIARIRPLQGDRGAPLGGRIKVLETNRPEGVGFRSCILRGLP